MKKHNPKKLINILKSFSENNNILKFTTHSWDFGREEYSFNDFDGFLVQIKDEWDKHKNDIKELSPHLYEKYNAFLVDENHTGWNTIDEKKGLVEINFGWSSPELKEYSDEDNQPYSMVLPNEYREKINNRSIDRFSDIAVTFKNDVEIRTEERRLKRIFIQEQKFLGFDFKKEYLGFENIDFITDVEYLQLALRSIFESIKENKQKNEIIVSVFKEEEYIEIHIIQRDRITQKTSEEMLVTTKGGRFKNIKDKLTSLCDWSVECQCTDGNYKINYLHGEKINTLDKLEYTPVGFTHILKFYR